VDDRSAVVNVIATFHPLSFLLGAAPAAGLLAGAYRVHQDRTEPLATVVLCVAAVVFLLVGLGFTRF
jgi:hypothetical protein